MRDFKFSAPGVISAPGGDLSKTGCCCPSVACCMYPAQALTDALYTIADLPEAVTVIGVGEYTKLDPPELAASGYLAYYKNGSNAIGSGDENIIHLRDDLDPIAWEVWNGGSVAGGGECLITGDGNLTPGDDAIEDQFEPTYTFTIFGDSLDLDRDSLCVWSGLDSRGATWQLNYSNEPDGPEWYITAYPHDGEFVYDFSGQLVEAGSGDPAGLYRDTYAKEGTLS